MTKEEAIKQLKDNRVLCINSETEPFAIAYDMAIKALEQQSCDCVSRASVKELFQEGCVMGMYDFLGIDDLPHVTPTFSNDATNYDVLKAVLGNTSAFRIKDTMEFEKGFESWFSKPYKRGDSDGSN